MPAPWPDSTKEEDLAYEAAAQLADFEFQREVIQQGGPRLRGHVDADKVDFYDTYPNSQDSLAFYRPFLGPSQDALTTALNKGMERVNSFFPEGALNKQINENIMPRSSHLPSYETKGDRISVLGTKGATKETLAHEFTHRGMSGPMKSLANIFTGEERTRLADAFRADTPEQWASAIRYWANQQGFDDYKYAEKDLREALEKRKVQFLTQEAQARAGDRPMNRADGKPSLYRDQEDALFRRQRSWDVDAFNARAEADFDRYYEWHDNTPENLAREAEQQEADRYWRSDEGKLSRLKYNQELNRQMGLGEYAEARTPNTKAYETPTHSKKYENQK